MVSRSDLAAAVAAGIITARQAERLIGFLERQTRYASAVEADPDNTDPEAVRFARGMHDIFLAIGLVVLIVGVAATVSMASRTAAAFGTMAVAWLLAEFYAKQKRLVLPSIVIALCFAAVAGWVFWIVVGLMLKGSAVYSPGRGLWADAMVPMLIAIGAASGSVVFFLRFRLPFALGLIAVACVAGFVLSALFVFPGLAGNSLHIVILIAGIAVFCVAMSFDLSDPERRTLRSDNAFWLHLVAAPLIVRSVIGFVTDHPTAGLGALDAILVVVAMVCLAVIALIVDRRALLVAGLLYLGYAVATILREVQMGEAAAPAFAALFLGLGIVLLGTFWRVVRKVVVRHVVPGALAARLPSTAMAVS